MLDQQILRTSAENWENEGGGLPAQTEAEVLGITRFLSETYVIGGYFYTKLAGAVAQGRRMQSRGTRL